MSRAAAVFDIHRFVALGFGLLAVTSPESNWKSFAPVDYDLTETLYHSFSSILVRQSLGIFTVGLASLVHVARRFSLWEQIQLSRALAVSFGLKSLLYAYETWRPHYPAMTGATSFFALIYGGLCYLYLWACLEPVKLPSTLLSDTTKAAAAAAAATATTTRENDNSHSQWAFQTAFTTHATIALPFAILSLMWPRGFYTLLKDYIADDPIPFELFGIQSWGCSILALAWMAWQARSFGPQSQWVLSRILAAIYGSMTVLYVSKRHDMNLLYQYGGTPVFGLLTLLYSHAVVAAGVSRLQSQHRFSWSHKNQV